jgi:hypothetical protein
MRLPGCLDAAKREACKPFVDALEEALKHTSAIYSC